MDNLLNFFISYNLYRNFPNNFNWDDLRHFNDTVNNFFNDFLNFNNFRY